ncbi:MAG: ATP synthase F1 subunit delta [Bacteroidetes bacterium]|nr:ATP synthase F1 subunit delta [Bacteroidota bacterium]
MSDYSIALRYAKAIVEATKEQKAIEALTSDFGKLAPLLQPDHPVADMIANPMLSPEKKIAVLSKAVPGLSEVTLQALNLLAKHKREPFLAAIITRALELIDETNGIIRAETTTAIPLSQEQATRLKKHLSEKTGKTVILVPRIDPSIKGGLVVRIHDTVYDSSLKNQLEVIKTKLLN